MRPIDGLIFLAVEASMQAFSHDVCNIMGVLLQQSPPEYLTGKSGGIVHLRRDERHLSSAESRRLAAFAGGGQDRPGSDRCPTPDRRG